jgi:hypothetical protein
MSAEFINAFSVFISRSVAFTTAHPWTPHPRQRDPKYNLITAESPLRALGTRFHYDLDVLDTVKFATWTPSTTAEGEVYRKSFHLSQYILKKMHDKFHIRETEFLQALILLERVLTSQHTSTLFQLTDSNLPMALTVASMLAEKMNSDAPIANTWWSQVFHVTNEHLTQSEDFFLQCLDYDIMVSTPEFQAAQILRNKILFLSRTSSAFAPP